MARHFFSSTTEAAQQITGLFDFVWPTAAALWNLRWQVDGFVKAAPGVTDKEIETRFVFGSKIQGANLRRACLDHSWDQQKSIFASFVVTNAFAIYEGWAEEVSRIVGNGITSKMLQFPDAPGKPGVQSAIAAASAGASSVIKDAFYDKLVLNKHYSKSMIGECLKCYRYFKEVRNSQIHFGGIADARAEAAYVAFNPLNNATTLKRKEPLAISPAEAGKPTQLHLRGAAGFCEIILRIMETLDAELALAASCDAYLLSRFQPYPRGRFLSADRNRRHEQVKRICQTVKLPSPVRTGLLYDYIRSNGIVSI